MGENPGAEPGRAALLMGFDLAEVVGGAERAIKEEAWRATWE
jgi:hypothetical protein